MAAPDPSLTPYSPSGPVFRFRALAALAGRSALGGPREIALATYFVARLAHDCAPAMALPEVVRAARASTARSWLANIALPSSVRAALSNLADATAGDVSGVSAALATVMTATAMHLDPGARLELERLAAVLAK